MTQKITMLYGFILLSGLSAQKPMIYTVANPSAHNSVTYIFAHGLGATYKQANIYAPTFCEHPYPVKNTAILGTPLLSLNFPDALDDAMHYYKYRVNLGQEWDMYTLKEAYEQALIQFPGTSIILCGVSRGAVTILNTMARYHLPHVKALIVESPFDDLAEVIMQTMKRFYLSSIPAAAYIGRTIMAIAFPLVDLKGTFPINHIEKISKDVPILLVHSKEDRVIPINCSRRLYRSLVMAEHQKTYLCELDKGKHARVLCGPQGELYQAIVHGFYKVHDLPSTLESALTKDEFLTLCKPSLEAIEKAIDADTQNGFNLSFLTTAFSQLKHVIKQFFIL